MTDETIEPTSPAADPGDASPDDAQIAPEITRLEDEEMIALVDQLEGLPAQALQQLINDREEARADRLRALAEVRNNQRRAAENEERVEQAARGSVYRAILPVVDQMDMALDQDLEAISVRQLADGVRIARDELSKILSDQGVSRIDPVVGEAFDPVRHEAMLRQEADDIESDHIVMVMQPGYAMGERVLRPAKVTVAT